MPVMAGEQPAQQFLKRMKLWVPASSANVGVEEIRKQITC